MDNNRRYSDWEDEQMNYRPKPRNQEENQREGKDINRNRDDQNWQDQYRSGQNYRNHNEGSDRNQTHYGARSDSAYRDSSRINYGDNQSNQRYDQNQNHFQNRNNYQNRAAGNNDNNRNQSGYGDQRHDYYNDPPKGDHAGTRYWGEREGYKEDDYRYTSGNRGWEAPGLGSNKDNQDEDRNRYRQNRQDYRHDDQNRDRGFFERMGDSASNAWNNLTGNDNNDNDNDYRNRHSDNRRFNRGYESGPRWANDNHNDRDDRDRHNRRYND